MSSKRTPTTQVKPVAQESGGPGRHGLTALYRSGGEELHHLDVDVEAASLTRRGTVAVRAGVQYAWPHPSRQYLSQLHGETYYASSDAGSHAIPRE